MNRFDIEFWNGVLKTFSLVQSELSKLDIKEDCKEKVMDTIAVLKASTERVHINNLREMLEEASVME